MHRPPRTSARARVDIPVVRTCDDTAVVVAPMRAVDVMRARNARMHTAESVANGTTNFALRPDDVVIATYPKTGTTWTMQVMHQIRCAAAGADGESFEEITEVVPWDVLASDCGQDLNASQGVWPRLFKSHESAETAARGGRYCVVVRDPVDVFHSFYRFLPAYMGIEPGAITKEEFAEAIFAGASHSGGFDEHYLSWHDAREADPENVCIVTFEDMKLDLGRVVDELAAFMRVELDDAGRALVLARSSFEYMSNNPKFDDHFVRGKIAAQIGLPPNSTFTVGKVREDGGVVGEGARELPASVRDAIEDKWTRRMGARGFATYDDFRRAVNRGRRT